MNQLDYKIKETVDFIRCNGLNSQSKFQELYAFTLSHLDDLRNLALFQLSGTLYGILALEKVPGCTRFPNIAYYCLTRGASAIQPAGALPLIQENWLHSHAERAKLLLSGGLKLISDRIHIIRDMPHQQAYDLSVLGDILYLRSCGYNSNENWWLSALEDAEWIRKNYSHLSDSDIRKISMRVHNRIAEEVYDDLKTFADDFGFIN